MSEGLLGYQMLTRIVDAPAGHVSSGALYEKFYNFGIIRRGLVRHMWTLGSEKERNAWRKCGAECQGVPRLPDGDEESCNFAILT